jgi:hypothetical protein
MCLSPLDHLGQHVARRLSPFPSCTSRLGGWEEPLLRTESGWKLEDQERRGQLGRGPSWSSLTPVLESPSPWLAPDLGRAISNNGLSIVMPPL